MNNTTLRIWCDLRPDHPAIESLRHAAEGHTLLIARSSPEPAALLSEADVAWGQPDVATLLRTPGVKWVEVTSAGYTRFDRDDVRQAMRQRGGVLTNSSGVFAEPCAQHLLAMMLALSRQLPHYWHRQQQRAWKNAADHREAFLLHGQTALLVGYGAIGQRLAEMLRPMGMRLIAVRRSPRGNEGIETIAQDQIDRVLPLADHVLNSLPDSESTRRFISAQRIAMMKRGAIFYNVGRGATVDQEALRRHLESGHLSAAYLDVTSPEPLPADDPLWTTPNCHITPHVAGGHAGMWDRLIRHFAENLRRFQAGEDLADRVM